MEEMDKKKAGLTNPQIAELIWNLNDEDFVEVFENIESRIQKELTVGEFIDICISEVKNLN